MFFINKYHNFNLLLFFFNILIGCQLQDPYQNHGIVYLENRANKLKLNYSIDTLSLLSTVCGCGLDMIPIPGDTLSDEIASLILDISALSINLKKPLGVRLLPIPEKTSGMMTSFNYDFLVNTRVMLVKNDSFESFKFTDEDQIYKKLRH